MDTIFAPATARGRAGVAVVRISGPDAQRVLVEWTGRTPVPRQAHRVVLRADGEVLDDALVLFFPGPASFTGEDVAELHLHGSQAVMAAVLAALGERSGCRLAEPGEFTRRALLNGKLDLSQVEGLADLIDAETEAQRRQAQRTMSGYIARKVATWRTDLVRALALLEATIDFVDEDVPVDVTPEVCGYLDRVIADLKRETAGAAMAERIRDGFEVAIVGEPNSGKSTLLNRLAGRDAAITSAVPGTTRDVIEVRMDLRGLAVSFLDTAGLRDAEDPVEQVGIRQGMARARAADVRVILSLDGAVPAGIEAQPGDLVVRAKGDLCGSGVSGLTGLGVDELVDHIAAELSERSAAAAGLTRARHRIVAERARVALVAAKNALSGRDPRVEFVSEDIRQALRQLEELVGAVGVEDVLDEIFARFCIGK